jgi:hypothetical protein
MPWLSDLAFVSLKEDASPVSKDCAPENMAILRRMAFSLAQARTPGKMTVQRAGFRAGLNGNFALEHFFDDNEDAVALRAMHV